MARRLKRGIDDAEMREIEVGIRKAVEDAIRQVEQDGDAALRAIFVNFVGLDRDAYRLGHSEIQACADQLIEGDLDDSRFEQAQIRNFAQIQRALMRDVNVETLPGVILGHKSIPMSSVGCYVPGGKYPILAWEHMSVVTAQVAGVKRIVTCAPPFEGKTPLTRSFFEDAGFCAFVLGRSKMAGLGAQRMW